MSGLYHPVDFEVASNGDIYFAEKVVGHFVDLHEVILDSVWLTIDAKGGSVQIFTNGALRPDPVINLRNEVNGLRDRG